MAREVMVELGARAYKVVLHEGAFEGLGAALRSALSAERVALVTESTVGPLWADELRAELAGAGLAVVEVVLPAGEANKTLATWQQCVSALLHAGVDRRTPVVALGGGVLGDIAGFSAASVLRGVPFVQVPTTLLAMVDSSVGGKTGVNHANGKNLVGAFHQPSLVWAGLRTLTTLSDAERGAGLGEVVKTALLDGEEFLGWCERHAAALRSGEPGALSEAIARCVVVKAGVVALDEREQGLRAILNAGHTVGHGLEASLGFGRLRHGEAVGLGLIAETAWAEAAGHCAERGLFQRLAALVGALGLPVRAPAFDRPDAVRAMAGDKKLVGGVVRVPVAARVGEVFSVGVPVADLDDLLDHVVV